MKKWCKKTKKYILEICIEKAEIIQFATTTRKKINKTACCEITRNNYKNS